MMEHLINSRHKRLLSAMLIGAASLYGQSAFAQIYDTGVDGACLEDAFGKKAVCTANDVRVAKADNIEVLKIGEDDAEPGTTVCVAERDVTFSGDFYIVTGPERFDIGMYYQNDGGPNAKNGFCTVYTLDNTYSTNAWNGDGDACLDIAAEQTVIHATELTVLCEDTDGDGQLNLPNCVSWRQPGQNPVCSDESDLAAGTPSKCNCDDTFNIPIFIQPDPPTITKDVTPLTGEEPDQVFTYSVKIEPAASTGNDVYVTKIEDTISSSTNGGSPVTFVLNDGSSSDVGMTLGYYTLISSGTPVEAPEACENIPLPYKIPPEVTGLECTFKLKISDEDLPNKDGESFPPEKFENFIKATIVDEYGDPVGDNSCSAPSTGNCSNEKTVTLTNVAPTISVTKSANPDSIVENTVGIPVTYTVLIRNTSPVDDVKITSISDVPYNIATEAATCIGQTLGRNFDVDDYCTFQYTRDVTGNTGDPAFANTVTAYAIDNENDTAQDSDSASVAFTDSPGDILLVKKPDENAPGQVPESGGDVQFTFTITNTSAVDYITLTKLEDNKFGVLFDENDYLGTCNFYGHVLAPTEFRECTYLAENLSGEPSEPHMNTATVTGITDDVVPETLTDSDDGKVVFIDEPADVDLAVDLEITVFLEIENASDYEPVNLNFVKLGTEIVSTALATTNYKVTANSCFPTVIAASGTHTCQFTVDILNFAGLSDVGTALQISVTDGDGGVADEEAVTVKAQLVSGL
ncbi:hypothetical protein [Vibrio sp. FJH11]